MPWQSGKREGLLHINANADASGLCADALAVSPTTSKSMSDLSLPKLDGFRILARLIIAR
jgi:hypothetical protein